MKLYLYLLVAVLFCNVYATERVDSRLTNLSQEKLESIELIKENLIQAKKKLIEKESEFKKTKDSVVKATLENEIKRLKARYDKLKLNLISEVTEIRMDEIEDVDLNKKRDYLQEAQELLGPAFDTIQRISERPRKIEALRKELNVYNKKLKATELALKNIDIVKSSEDFQILLPDVEDFLSDATYNVNDLNREYKVKADRLDRELGELTKDDKSLVEAFADLARQFLKSKGKHLGIAILIFTFIIWSFTALKNGLILKSLQKTSIEWLYKPINALYGILTFILALSLSVFSLYVMGDWVLVTLIVLLLSALLWGSKSYIHKYLAEGRLILNLGTIKEGELVVFRGIPWRVKNINFVSIFENEYLDSSTIRVEISHLFQMHSRKILSNEQWFPSKTDDWVLLSDGTFGQVKLQTVEQVVLELKSTERKFYMTSDYLSLRPVNLSQGFHLEVVWGFDYNDQKNLLDQIIPKFKGKVAIKLKESGIQFEGMSFEFQEAMASSLNVILEVQFHGKFANKRFDLLKKLNQVLLIIANEEGLNIPFNQVVVHKA